MLTGLFEDEIPITRLVNIRRQNGERPHYDILIDRSSDWGNPYSHKPGTKAKWKVETREEAIAKYREYILTRQDLLDRLGELEGKILGCWCKPLACHGDVLLELIYARYEN